MLERQFPLVLHSFYRLDTVQYRQPLRRATDYTMPKSYTDELSAWVKDRAIKKRRRDEAAVAFMAVKTDVQAAIAAGYSLVTIWEHMRETGKVKFSYETFRSHARRHIKLTAPTATPAKPVEPPPAPRSSGPGQPEQGAKPHRPAQPAPPAGFTYNPTPDREELL